MSILKHPRALLPAAFSTSTNHALFHTQDSTRSLLHCFQASLFLLFERMNCPSSHSSTRIHDATLFCHPLDLQPHILFHLRSFPLFANVLGLLYSKNKTKQTYKQKPSFNPNYPLHISSFLLFPFPCQVSRPFSSVPSPYLPVFAPSKWLPPKSISTLLPSQLFSIFPTLSLQHREPLATCFKHPACLALPYPGVPPVLLTITSLPPSVVLISRFSLRYSPEFYICLLLSLPFLSLLSESPVVSPPTTSTFPFMQITFLIYTSVPHFHLAIWTVPPTCYLLSP